MSKKNRVLDIQGNQIVISLIDSEDYFSLTDIVKIKDGDFFVSDWLRNRNTLEYLAAWESLHNPDFNYGEFAIIKDRAGLNSQKVSTKEWTEKTNAIGIRAKTGRYGGTYAHKDIAFHFGMWISPQFQLLIVKEYQRLKEVENNSLNLEWDAQRFLSKANYRLLTDAIEEHILKKRIGKNDERFVYVSEADIVNLVVFGCTAKEWRDKNIERALKGENIRQSASINELNVLNNIEYLSSLLIKKDVDKEKRIDELRKEADSQLNRLNKLDRIRSVKKLSETTYVDFKINNLPDYNKKLK